MSFGRAFKYPFHNSSKVLSIVLVLTIAFVFCIALVVNSFDLSPYFAAEDFSSTGGSSYANDEHGSGAVAGILGILLVLVFGGFWISGYSVSAVGEVMNGNDTLPSIDFGSNLRRGFWLFLSGLVYILANVIVWGCLYFVTTFVGFLGDIITLLAFLATLIAGVAFAALSGWAYFIGMARYAVEGDRSPLFEVAKNIGTARKNVYVGVRLTLRIVALTGIYGIVSTIVDSVLGGLAGEDIVVGAALWISVYYIFNLFQHFSTQHLIAQYAMAVGVGQSPDNYKPKPENYD